ncbi:glycoside hydrolase family 2 [Parabacteroides sp. OttesenSCG-928-G06]|nr:glycoside hydrolase family 2 [Parabacteroides sp. OttesenSCG-928-G06]
MMRRIFLFLFTCSLIYAVQAQDVRSLAGEWRFRLDQEDAGIAGGWQNEQYRDRIQLPGTTDDAHYGEKTVGSDFGMLTRAYKYYGPAWYQKDIDIPQEWKGKRVLLTLERVMWESRVFLDGKEISLQDALNSPHVHDLGFLAPGRHTLTIRINNDLIYNVGDKGHVYTDATQIIWNGVVGDILLSAQDVIHFSNPQLYPRIQPKTLQIKDVIVNESGKKNRVEVALQLTERKSGLTVYRETFEQTLMPGANELDHTARVPQDIKLWSDVTPDLYILTMSLTQKGKTFDATETEFGFREVTASASKILVNGKPVFLRGNLDCVHFPLTGYPSCKVEEWERIFRIYKEYGLNHVRFHSWCPPKAAFVAADRIGIYMQPEVIWIDWWMTNTPEDRPDMITRGNPDGLGKNPSADEFVQKELTRMLDAYGNHPSFVMQCIGNELGNSDFDVMEQWMIPLREKDSRRLYAVSTARKIMAVDQYMATHYIQGIGSTRGLRGGASTDWDFEEVYKQSNIPIIAHEIGQWPVYPRWSEIKKYKGVLKARNLEEFREVARKNKIESQNEAFVQSSGALNQIMYKYEIESFLRTPSCAGIQLLSMQDYQGQGEAIVGWLDVFYDSKGITTPEKFRCHHDTVVPLLRMPKYVWQNNEMFRADIQLAQYGTEALNDGMYWKIYDESLSVLAKGTIHSRSYPVGSSEIAGKIAYDLSGITAAKKLTIEVGLENDAIANSWQIWVYPAAVQTETKGIHVTERMDAETIRRLEKGEKVLLLASSLGTEKTADKIAFYPLYWSLTFFPGQGRNTIGMVVQDSHPLFENFPTDWHSDWQWESIYKGARAFYINDYPETYRPMAQPIDDFHRNNKIASIFEMKAGKGSLLVCGFDIKEETNPAARQLKHSILNYMQSDKFCPEYEQPIAALAEMFTYVEPLQSTVAGEFSQALLYASPVAEESKRNSRYEISGVEKKTIEGTTVWEGSDITLTIRCPQGVIGSLYVCFTDLEKQRPQGDILFEGRNFELGRQQEKETWVKFHVMREDSNDGMLVLKAKGKQAKKLQIAQFAFSEE